MRVLKALLKVVLGLTLGLVLAEALFWFRDDGAFPHLNLYRTDERLGVSLLPEASMKLRIAEGNPVTAVTTNSSGFRAPEWGPVTPGEVLVVGDSQVFGLGVETNETFTARLHEILGVPTLNAGVPTYGPREYTEVVRDTLRRRKVSTVVYVLNLSNDLFEVDRPNTQRHTVWDGWAVRTETAPSEVTDFPFRRELMTRSHLIFAARQWLHSMGQPAAEGFATEGNWKDVVDASSGVKPVAPDEADVDARRLLEARNGLGKQLDEVAGKLAVHFRQRVQQDREFAEGVRPLVPKGGDPRDIFQVRFAEAARPPSQTAFHLVMAAIGETKNEALLEKLAKENKDPELQRLIIERRALRLKLDELRPAGEPAHVVPIERVLLETKAVCDAAGARLLVVALPLDVMVSAEEWKKYGVAPLDMSATKVLVDDVVARAERVGAIGLDPTAALAAVEPGVFLQGDLHLTPKGHAALAQAIAEAMKRPAKPRETLSLPEGRSWPPTEDEWRREKECVVKGSTKAGCETKLVREWLWVRCSDTSDAWVNSIEVISGGHGDAFTSGSSRAELLIPLVEGDSARVVFRWPKLERELKLEFPKGGERVMAFTEPVPRAKAGEALRYQRREIDPLAPMVCPDGEHVTGALRRCAKACPCDVGHCEPWPGRSFCAMP